ncbi:MAG: class I SAM-dependent methyltransferase [Rhodobacteraceae bacterium]|nr:class I SAM-dependent methyltransferase [Paracoccaceae bacterium]
MPSPGDLHRYFLNNGSKILHKWFHYFDIYERHFERFRDRPITMLEIGVFGGGSLEMCQSYFHPESRIVGLDINPKCKRFEGGNIEVHIGSQDDPNFLGKLVKKYKKFDIILDDGSHINSHVIKTFEALYEHVSSNGVYFVEDMHTSYWKDYGGGLKKEGTFIEFAKNHIDQLNAAHVPGDDYPVTEFTRTTNAIAFYDSVVVFEKRLQGTRQHAKTGPLKKTDL